jgi:hypothetical protein
MSSATEDPRDGGSSPSELRVRKKAGAQKTATNGTALGSLDKSDIKEDSVTWGKTPDGTSML